MSGTVVIVGGAIVGSMAAYFLREGGYQGRVVVLERDPTYAYCSTARSVAGIRTQFGCPINIRMSRFGAAFLRSVKDRFGPEADVGFRERGYLVLGPGGSAEARRGLVALQAAEGASIAVLTPGDLATRYPWLRCDDLGVGTLGLADEGWFDAWSLLQLVRNAARRLGAEYRHAEACGFDTVGDRVTAVRISAGDTIVADWVVNAAGPAAGRIAAWLGIALPIVPRKRTGFHFRADLDGSTLPLLFDTSSVWMRPEGQGFIAGLAPPGPDPDAEGDFEPDHALFEELVWPALAHRIPALERLRLDRAWAGHYEVNTLDHNGVVGPHDVFGNLILAAGFSGHGVMHAPATGRGVAELILHGRYRTLDLAPLGYGRVRAGRPMVEPVVY